MIADYYILRGGRLNLAEYFKTDGEYSFKNGFNPVAIGVLIVSILPNVPGFLVQIKFLSAESVPTFLQSLYTYAWFVGFALAFGLYSAHGRLRPASAVA